jgi:hypothetical protein
MSIALMLGVGNQKYYKVRYFFGKYWGCHGNHFGQVLVELAELQDREVGDGTTSVVIIAAELLKVSEQG